MSELNSLGVSLAVVKCFKDAAQLCAALLCYLGRIYQLGGFFEHIYNVMLVMRALLFSEKHLSKSNYVSCIPFPTAVLSQRW